MINRKKLFEKKYKDAWKATLSNGQLGLSDVEKSKFFFETINGSFVPKKFDTYSIVCCLPFSESFQKKLDGYWKQFTELLSDPISYGVKPENRHVEIFLFQRPEEMFLKEEVKGGIEKSLVLSRKVPAFKILFRYPFMTPDGTIVVPGFDDTETVESLRLKLRKSLSVYPQKQSQWLHTSLGRILEPLDKSRLEPLLNHMEAHWGEVIGEITVDRLQWMWEKQWYMVDKEIISEIKLVNE